MRIGFFELIVILAIILVILGPRQIPKLTKVLTASIRSFKEGAQEEQDKDKEDE